MFMLCGWDGNPQHGAEVIQGLVPVDSVDAVMKVADKLCGPRWARVFVLEYVGEVMHPDFYPFEITVPLNFNQDEYLKKLTKHLLGAPK